MKAVAYIMFAGITIPLFYFFWMIFGSSIFVIGLLAIPFGIAGLYNAVYVSKNDGSYDKYQIWTLDNKDK